MEIEIDGFNIKTTNGIDVLVSRGDYKTLSKYQWSARKIRNTFYCFRDEYLGSNKSRRIYMHRYILLGTESSSKDQIDHIDGNGLNNCRYNLRKCSVSENLRNRGKNKNNTSGYKGVKFHKQTGKFRATIWLNRKEIHLGVFKTAEEAYQSYCVAAKKYHGHFARF